MSKSAVVLCLNGRRRTIKFTTNSTVAQILEDVCAKENIDSTVYDLRTSRSVLDRTLPWRFTNLPNNAKLELCSREAENQLFSTNVKIAFQLPDNQRLTGEFATETLLSDIVKHFAGPLQSFTSADDDVAPAIVYMRQKFVGNEVLSSTSLQKLGIKGSALLRFSFESSPTQPDPHTSVAKPSGIARRPEVKAAIQHKDDKTSEVQSSSKSHPLSKPGSNAVKASPKPSPKMQKSPRRSPKTSPHSPSQSPPVVDIPMHDSDSETERCVKPPVFMDTVSSTTNNVYYDATSHNNSEKKSSPSNTVPNKRSKVEASSSHQRPKQSDLANFKFPVATRGVDLMERSNTSTDDSALLSACDRNAVLFNERVGENRGNATAEESDDFFEVTIDDLRVMMADLKHERKKLEEQEMLTDEQRRSRKITLATKYPTVVIRIVLPERLILQGFFRPLEKVQNVYEFVKEHVNTNSFYLFTTPPKKILKDKNASLFDHNLAPAARVYFGSEKAPCLNNFIKQSSSHLLRTVEEANQDLQRLKA